MYTFWQFFQCLGSEGADNLEERNGVGEGEVDVLEAFAGWLCWV